MTSNQNAARFSTTTIVLLDRHVWAITKVGVAGVPLESKRGWIANFFRKYEGVRPVAPRGRARRAFNLWRLQVTAYGCKGFQS